MRISRVQIKNFANFSDIDISTGESIVVVGENKVGKTNFIRALQLILDPSLSERDRQLRLEHFWDGLDEFKIGEQIEVAIEFTDFDNNSRLMAHLCDCVVAPGPPMVARVTYRFQPKASLGREPETIADYEYIIFGGKDPNLAVPSAMRRMLPLDVQIALRDTEKDLASWRNSPLRPLIELLATSLDEDASDEIQELFDTARDDLAFHSEVIATAERISDRLTAIAGEQHAVDLSLGLAPTRIDALLRGLRLLIDDGARGVSEASLGTANLIFLALKSLELDRLVSEGERDHTFLAIEEPEAHLHPHVQRLVYRYFLGSAMGTEKETPITTILTTHSPHIASVTPIRSIVLLRQDASKEATVAVSTAAISLTKRDEADLQRYIDVTRGEIFFARGVILVEGDAERFLVPAFADSLEIPLDVLGITVCSVGGTNFTPYVKLLGPQGLNIPHVILTDRDPNEPKEPLVRSRLIKIARILDKSMDLESLCTEDVIAQSEKLGVFVNGSTLELELFASGLSESMARVISSELSLGQKNRAVLQKWVEDPRNLNETSLLSVIERIGKGRFAQALASYVSDEACPEYIRCALERIRDAVT